MTGILVYAFIIFIYIPNTKKYEYSNTNYML